MFLLKKFIASFFMPLPVFFILFGIGLFLLYAGRRKRAVQVLSGAVIWLALLSYAPFSALLLSPLENAYPKWQSGSAEAAYIHVLGYGHDSDEALPLSSQPHPTSLVRTVEGVMVYRQNKNAKIIFSGYGGDDALSDAAQNARVAVALGVNPEDIIVLEAPRDTAEEAAAAEKIAGGKKIVLVTSAAHMPRAMALFERAGLAATAAPTDFRAKHSKWLTWPSSNGLKQSEIAFHEYLGILWMRIKS